MSWELLPIDLTTQILAQRYILRNQAIKTIQNNWRKYMQKDIIAIDISLEIEIDENSYMMVSSPDTAKILDFCANIISGKHDEKYWLIILEGIKEGLSIIDNIDIYYNQSQAAYHKILTKFNLSDENIIVD